MKTTIRISSSVIIAAMVLLLSACSQKTLQCHSPELNVTIKYNNKTVLNYITDGANHFTLEDLNHIAEEVGLSQLLQDYRYWFESETGCPCK